MREARSVVTVRANRANPQAYVSGSGPTCGPIGKAVRHKWMIVLLLSCSALVPMRDAFGQPKDLPIPLSELRTKWRDAGASITGVQSGKEKGTTVTTFDLNVPQAHQPVTSVKRHVYGGLAPTGGGTGLFYDQAFSWPDSDPYVLAQSKRPVMLSTQQFFKLLQSIRTMAVGTALKFPHPIALEDHARNVYKLTGAVPLGVIDIEFDRLGEIDPKKVGLASDARFVPTDKLRYQKHALLAVAPLISGIPAKSFDLVIPSAAVISNRQAVPKSYTFRVSAKDQTIAVGKPVAVKVAKGDILPFAIQSRGKQAASWIHIVPLGGTLSDVRASLLRSAGRQQVKALYATSEESVWRAMDENLVPYEPGTDVPARLLLPTMEWAGIEVGIWWSPGNKARPADQRVVCPLFILGGQDQETNDPQLLYIAMVAQLGAERFAELAAHFDIFVLSYFTGGGTDECDSTAGEASGCRLRGIGRSVVDNSVLLADSLAYLYQRYGIKEKGAFVGISMGGVVSRLAFLGIEKGPAVIGGITSFNSIPNLPSQEAPAAVWATIDAPFQGAYLPLSVQELVASFSVLPGLSRKRETLDSASSKEMLLEHYSTRTSMTPIASLQPFSYVGGERIVTAERQALLNTQRLWGDFPKTVPTSVAIASGGFAVQDIHRLPLWSLAGGVLPEVPAFSITIPSVPPLTLSSPGATIVGRNLPNVETVEQQTTSFLQTYQPLGPNSIPIQRTQMVFSQSPEVSLTMLMSEPTYSWGTFSEVRHPSYPIDFNNPSLERLRTDRLNMTFKLKAKVKINVLDIFDFNISVGGTGDFRTQTANGLKPQSLAVGGYRETARDIDSELASEDGIDISIRTYVPRHTFVPTFSALDISEEFLKAGYRKRFVLETNNALNQAFQRAKQRGTFNHEDFLDYSPFESVLQQSWSGGAFSYYTGRMGTIPGGDGGEVWSGHPSPFKYVSIQPNSFKHTDFNDATKDKLVQTLLTACVEPSKPPRLPPNWQPEWLNEMRNWHRIVRLDRLPPVPPLPDPTIMRAAKRPDSRAVLGPLGW